MTQTLILPYTSEDLKALLARAQDPDEGKILKWQRFTKTISSGNDVLTELDLSSYLPNDNALYEICILATCQTSGSDCAFCQDRNSLEIGNLFGVSRSRFTGFFKQKLYIYSWSSSSISLLIDCHWYRKALVTS